MPILPELKHLYPDNWKEIRQEILKRAENRCEFCGVPDHEIGYWVLDNFMSGDSSPNCIKIILTIAHLDHDPTNNDPENLRALCQRCHNRYDIKKRVSNRRFRQDKRQGQQFLF